MCREDRIKQFIKELKQDKLVQKNLYRYTRISGSSTVVHPITVWENEIVCQWECNKKIFDKFINRVVEKFGDLISYGYFSKSDGSCPATITFKLR